MTSSETQLGDAPGAGPGSAEPAGQPASPLAIEVRGLTMSYGDRHVLKNVTFDVKQGEVFCLLGPNGAGKTTTVEILEGFRQRTGGTVRVLGLDPAAQSSQLRERLGIVLQECGFPRQAKVAELIDMWRDYYPAPRPLEDLIGVVELDSHRDTQVRRLSGGQRRRLDLALALAGDPDLMFLDEPTTGFDPESRRRCWAAIENLRALGKTIVLTTHYLDEAERLADRLALLRDGEIQVCGPVREVARHAGVPTTITFLMPERVVLSAPGSARPIRSLAIGRASGATGVWGCPPGEYCGPTPKGSSPLVSTVPPPPVPLTVEAGVATCRVSNAAVALRELFAWAAANHLGDLDDLSVVNPTLEDAYLQLVSGGTQ